MFELFTILSPVKLNAEELYKAPALIMGYYRHVAAKCVITISGSHIKSTITWLFLYEDRIVFKFKYNPGCSTFNKNQRTALLVAVGRGPLRQLHIGI